MYYLSNESQKHNKKLPSNKYETRHDGYFLVMKYLIIK